ncbi:hypothetical protein [Jannaschia rubra]|uniref:Uncharacterized protein n=1 Tax=Jannaschia rubra TaxID=282197 RepID=A0A0M6XRB6_9RHOB|nr:hypothetical protein [Jannaschia rubra]CTQ33610.1 hypothetical protein JAN5088_02393 [Jannaschia rubra]SFG04871.1 hypothetical protein SAMN04488517_102439 [Jannaschia rubra]
MVREPEDAPVPERSKGIFYVGLVVAVVLGAVLLFIILPNMMTAADDGPAEGVDGIVMPSDDGLVEGDGDEIVDNPALE